MIKQRHNWIEADDLVAFYMARHGTRRLPLMDAGIARVLGVSEVSLARRQANFDHLDGRKGLDHVAAQSRRIHERYKNNTEPELRPMVLHILSAKRPPPLHK